MRLRLLAVLGFSLGVIGVPACGPAVDLGKTLVVADTLTGWYDAGFVDGHLKVVPSISFRLKNTGTASINEVQLTVSFWKDGDDGEWDSKEVQGIGAQSVAPGAMSDSILVRGAPGYTPEPGVDLFTHSLFRDATAKLFAKRGGTIAPLGEFKLDRRIIPHLSQASGRS